MDFKGSQNRSLARFPIPIRFCIFQKFNKLICGNRRSCCLRCSFKSSRSLFHPSFFHTSNF